LQGFFTDLTTAIDREPRVAPRGELLARAMAIPLAWPESEFPSGRSLVEQFKIALESAAGVVHVVADEAAAAATVARLIREAGARRVARWRTPRLNRLDWRSAFADLDLEWTEPPATGADSLVPESTRRLAIDAFERIEVGIIDADFGVAQTGTLALALAPERDGFTHLFPWHCIAVLWASQLVATLQDAGERLAATAREGGLRPSTLFLTGPSRSGDIDLRYGQGAAGPGMHHVIAIED
jgi:L-lactate dehydrogenase complex protein LldG